LRAVDSSDSPILLIRVYESTMANLVKLHTELAGLRALESHKWKKLTISMCSSRTGPSLAFQQCMKLIKYISIMSGGMLANEKA
jgi:hypothetical protein